MVKLISLDLDGTLLDPQGQTTPASKAAIALARAAEIRVVLNTGRPIPEACFFARQAGCDDLVSALGGAALADSSTGQVLQRQDLPQNTGRRVLELCLGRRIELMIFAGEEIVLDPFSKESLLRTYPYPVFHNNAVVVEDPLAYLEEHRLPLTKVHGDWNQPAYPLEELRALEGLELTSSNDHDFEVVPAGVDKGVALAQLAQRYGVPLDQCAAVGDSDNDLAMLQAAGVPIAMGNASQAVKDLALRVVADNGQDGVAAAILNCLDPKLSPSL